MHRESPLLYFALHYKKLGEFQPTKGGPLLSCELAGVCSGCEWIEKSDVEQKNEKKHSLVQHWEGAGLPIEDLGDWDIKSIAPGGLRDRVDLTTYRQNGTVVMGLYDRSRRQLVDMKVCPQMSPALAQWHHEFRQDLPNIDLGSVRLRISPTGQYGIWLDFPNQTIKNLLDSQEWLRRLSKKAVVEIGQRRKRLEVEADRLRLVDPKSEFWFETYLGEKEEPFPLDVHIGGFTQPGFQANQVLVNRLMANVKQTNARNWLELGSGIGNFTFALASWGLNINAVEFDRLAGENFNKSLERLRNRYPQTQVRLFTENFHKQQQRLIDLLEQCEGILVDPPRSGLRDFVKTLGALDSQKRPQHFVYVSCFAESFSKDIRALYDLGYKLQSLEGIDQFPQSPHCEFIGRLDYAKTPGSGLTPSTHFR